MSAFMHKRLCIKKTGLKAGFPLDFAYFLQSLPGSDSATRTGENTYVCYFYLENH